MIFIVIILQIVILAFLLYIENEFIPLKIESKMTYEYTLRFLSRYCAEHPDYIKSVFPKTWEEIQKGKINE